MRAMPTQCGAQLQQTHDGSSGAPVVVGSAKLQAKPEITSCAAEFSKLSDSAVCSTPPSSRPCCGMLCSPCISMSSRPMSLTVESRAACASCATHNKDEKRPSGMILALAMVAATSIEARFFLFTSVIDFHLPLRYQSQRIRERIKTGGRNTVMATMTRIEGRSLSLSSLSSSPHMLYTAPMISQVERITRATCRATSTDCTRLYLCGLTITVARRVERESKLSAQTRQTMLITKQKVRPMRRRRSRVTLAQKWRSSR
mmetsp:Transcript_33829/g.79211  ORF Transcript_33829/g.79211 Transcript_33829/m.79211 type:complete len:258 (-) Transcript_33829:117-890(-)